MVKKRRIIYIEDNTWEKIRFIAKYKQISNSQVCRILFSSGLKEFWKETEGGKKR